MRSQVAQAEDFGCVLGSSQQQAAVLQDGSPSSPLSAPQNLVTADHQIRSGLAQKAQKGFAEADCRVAATRDLDPLF